MLDAPGLNDRIAEAIERHNAAVRDGLGVGHYRTMLLQQTPETIEKLLLIDSKYSGRKRLISTVEALAGVRCWELAEDLERSRVGRNDLCIERDYEAHLASRSLVQLYGVDPAAFRIVYSRDHRLVGECSTGQRWSNCYTEDASNFDSVGAHIKRGGIVAYLVDQDDQDARYPFARILLTPKNAERGEATIYGLSRPFGSYGFSEDGIVERFRSSVFDVARRFGEGSSGSFQKSSDIPYSDAPGVPCRIAVWTEQDLLKVADEAIDKPGRKHSVADQVAKKRRFETVWKKRTDRALLADVGTAWKEFDEAKPVVVALAQEVGLTEAGCFVVELRDHAFRYTDEGVERLTEPVAVEAMRPFSNGVLATLEGEKRHALKADITHLFRAAASPTDRGDVVACALLASLGDEPGHERTLFERADELVGWLYKVQERRSRHLSEIADSQYHMAERRRDAMREEIAAVPNQVGAGATLDAFRNTWWSLDGAVKAAFGASAWERVRSVVVRDGMRVGLKRVEHLCSRTLGWRAGVLKWATGERGEALREEARSCARAALDELVPKWENARRLLDASRWSREIPNVEKSEFLLGVLGTQRVPSRFVRRGGPLADLERELEHGFHLAKNARGERLLARLLALELLEAVEADRRRAEAALQATADQRGKLAQMPGWIGATDETLRAYCWLTDPALLEANFTAENRETRNRVDVEDVARRAHGIIRFHKHADLPESGPLVEAVHRRLRERFPEYFQAAVAVPS